MTHTPITLRPAGGAQLDRVRALLDANDLPSKDVRETPGRFYLAYADDELIGVGGVESYGSNALLRSVVVERSRRGRGYGAARCTALEDAASSNSVETLYLLTTSAAAFFRHRGFQVIPRAAAPERIQRTRQFAELCPTYAVCMKKPLDPEP